ncbi:hypothetical protein AGOR_G00157430 [Albula goreensis]|uniref:TNFR-Cys domain-containing protein n=1 Tax=Albula goreensis TaxID=1534307 RepID=A0A8T3D7V2_9TELE|nr:hypothetical protein AGOR_G00157430 [Albula goreensis]
MDSLQITALCCLTWICGINRLLEINAAPSKCPKGKKNAYNKEGCVPCPVDQYMDMPNYKQFCMNCRTCNEKTGSEIASRCTAIKNSECRCRQGFVPNEEDKSSCKCAAGSELVFKEKEPTCVICQDGFFNDVAGKNCRKWSECGVNGVKISGSHKSDVECHSGPGDDHTPTISKPASALVQDEKHTTMSVVIPTTSAVFSSTASSTSTLSVSPTIQSGNDRLPGYVLALLPVLLLILVFPLFCKKIVIPSIQNFKEKLTTAAQPCRRPVEESGDSRSSLVKSCQGRP